MPRHDAEQRTIYDSLLVTSVIMLLFIRPTIVKVLPIWGVFRLAMVVASLFVIGFFILENKLVYRKQILTVILFFFARFLTTFLNSGSLKAYVENDAIMFAACLFFELWLQKSPETLFKARSVFEILIVINYISLYVFPNGMYSGENFSRNWVLGFNNLHVRIMLPGICLSMLCSYSKYGRMTVRPLLLLLVSFLSVLKVNSSTSIVGLAFFSILLFVLLVFDRRRLLSMINLFSGTLVIFAVDIAIVIMGRIGAVSFIIEDLLGKDASFTGRTDLWEKATDYFLKKPVFGYGYMSGEKYQRLLGNSQAIHPHNFLLYLLLTGGIFLLAVFVLMISMSGKMLSASGSPASKIILCTILSFFVMGISESLVGTNFLYPMFVLAMNVDSIDALQQNNTQMIGT